MRSLSTPPWGVLAILVISNRSTGLSVGNKEAASPRVEQRVPWSGRRSGVGGELKVRDPNFCKNQVLEGPDIYIRICRVAFPRVPNDFRYDAGNLTDRTTAANLAGNKGPVAAFIPDISKHKEVPYITGTFIPSPGSRKPTFRGVSNLVVAMCRVPRLYHTATQTAQHTFPAFPCLFHRQARAEAYRRCTPAINRSRVLLTKSRGITRYAPHAPHAPRCHAKRRKPETVPVLAF